VPAVARALRQMVSKDEFERVLSSFSEEARAFWRA